MSPQKASLTYLIKRLWLFPAGRPSTQTLLWAHMFMEDAKKVFDGKQDELLTGFGVL